MRKDDYKVALIVPVYNEHETVETFVKTVNEKLASELIILRLSSLMTVQRITL